jgi:phosphoglycerate dehydrogenase-like enzyme
MARLKVIIAFALAPRWVQYLTTAFPEVEFFQSRDKAEQVRFAAAADVIYGFRDQELVAKSPRLKWMHSYAAGVDELDSAYFEEHGILCSNSRGVAAPNIAEHVFAMMLSFARSLQRLSRAQSAQMWVKVTEIEVFELQGKRLGIVGLGMIGQEIANRAAVFGMRVSGMRNAGPAVAGVTMFAPDQLLDLAAQSDHLVVCLPGTAATAGMIGQKVLSAMPRGSYFYNIGRGNIVVQSELIAALVSGHLAGAGLDVMEFEPLPAGDALWHAPNILLTSHTAGNTDRYWERAVPLFERNLRAFMAGRPLENQVDLRRGY